VGKGGGFRTKALPSKRGIQKRGRKGKRKIRPKVCKTASLKKKTEKRERGEESEFGGRDICKNQ